MGRWAIVVLMLSISLSGCIGWYGGGGGYRGGYYGGYHHHDWR